MSAGTVSILCITSINCPKVTTVHEDGVLLTGEREEREVVKVT